LGQSAIVQIENTNSYVLSLEGKDYELSLEDFEITTDSVPGLHVATDKEITVALDVTLTDLLISEGIAKEIVNRIQNIRKSNGYNVTDKISVALSGNEKIHKAIRNFRNYISDEVLAEEMSLDNDLEGAESYELTKGVDVKITINRII